MVTLVADSRGMRPCFALASASSPTARHQPSFAGYANQLCSLPPSLDSAHLLLQIRNVCPVVLVHCLRLIHNDVWVRFRVPAHADAEEVAVLRPGGKQYEQCAELCVCEALSRRDSVMVDPAKAL